VLAQALIFVITTIAGLFTLALLLRFLLQLMRAPARNQLSAFLAAVTDFAVRPARRVIPGLWGLDLATLVLAWLTQLVQIWLVLAVKGYEAGPKVGVALIALAALAAVEIVKFTIYIAMVAIVMQAVLSWINPYSPLSPLLNSVTRPMLRPFQRFIPPVANVDLSPLVALIAFQLLLILPLGWLEATLIRLL
jgi:YggT family protein